MNFKFNHVGVDAGVIMICDEKYYEKYGYKFDKGLSFKRKVPNGRYNCHWRIPESWNGDVKGSGILEVRSGTIVVSDPCYCVEKWDELLDDTKILDNVPVGCVLLDKMGGDGDYHVQVTLDQI